MMRIGRAWCVLMLPFGCGAQNRLDAPDLSGVGTAALASYVDGKLEKALLTPFGESASFEAHEGDESWELDLLTFPVDVDIGFDVGSLQQSPAGASLPVPDALGAFRARDGDAFEAVPAKDLRLASETFVPKATQTACATVSYAEPQSAPATERPVATSLGGGKVIMTHQPGLALVTVDQIIPLQQTGGMFPGCIRELFPIDGGVGIVTCFGEVFRGRITDATIDYSVEVPWTGISRGLSVAARDRNGSTEAALLDAEGFVHLLRDGVWTVLPDGLAPPHADAGGGSIAFLSTGEIIAVSSSDKRALVHDGTETTFEEVSPRSGLSFVQEVPGLGPVIGTVETEFFVRKSGWTPVAQSHLKFWVNAIQPFQQGFVYGCPFGTLGQYVPGEGLCPESRPLASDIDELTPLDAEHFVVSSYTTGLLTWTVVTME